MAAQLAEHAGDATRAGLILTHLGAMTGRLCFPGGLTAASRHAGAEPLWTGRAQPYDESTLRRSLALMARWSGAAVVARHLEAQVETAVKAWGMPVTAFTDMFDQPNYTKKLAHSGPIGRLGNRILAASYWGMTFVRLPGSDVSLAYHLSAHKPATPLVDALVDVYIDPPRKAWMLANIRMHNWDRGGNGEKVLLWALNQGIPYLTLSGKTAHWTRMNNATQFTEQGVPVFDRRDTRNVATTAAGLALMPSRVTFPAHPEKGTKSSKSLVYLTAADLTREETVAINQVYKERWGSMENQIKNLIAVGFDINRERAQHLVTSRGVDGKLVALDEKESVLLDEIAGLEPALTQAERNRVKTRRKKLRSTRAKRTALRRKPLTKHARALTGGEIMCKNLLLMTTNALALVLTQSMVQDIQMMTPQIVRELLLGRSALARLDGNAITLFIDRVADARQRRLQEELVRLFDSLHLNIRGQTVRLRLQNRSTIQRFQI